MLHGLLDAPGTSSHINFTSPAGGIRETVERNVDQLLTRSRIVGRFRVPLTHGVRVSNLERASRMRYHFSIFQLFSGMVEILTQSLAGMPFRPSGDDDDGEKRKKHWIV